MIIDALCDVILKTSLHEDSENFRIDNITHATRLYRMNGCDRVFDDLQSVILALPNAYGFAYFQEPRIHELKVYVGRDAREVLKERVPNYFKVALLDALFGTRTRGGERGILYGNKTQKARERARLLLKEITPNARILLIGATSDIAHEARAQGRTFRMIDLESQKIGISIDGIMVEDGTQGKGTLQAIRESDHVIATGMIFSTGTADAVLDEVRASGAKLTLFLETGAHFGEMLLAHGADIVFAEQYPFYTFPGPTEYCVYRRSGV